MKPLTLEELKERGFNLSILECKYFREVEMWQTILVLIYPYWNVNTVAEFNALLAALVLIYPYWNVNVGGSIETFNNADGFNLSILECKCISAVM